MDIIADISAVTATYHFITSSTQDIEALILAAERLFPATSSGPAKLEWVRQELMQFDAFVAKADTIWPVLSKYIAIIVKLLPRNTVTTAIQTVVS